MCIDVGQYAGAHATGLSGAVSLKKIVWEQCGHVCSCTGVCIPPHWGQVLISSIFLIFLFFVCVWGAYWLGSPDMSGTYWVDQTGFELTTYLCLLNTVIKGTSHYVWLLLLLFFLDRVSYWTWSLPDWLEWLASSPPAHSWLSISHTEFVSIHHHDSFYVGAAGQAHVFVFVEQALYGLSHIPSPSTIKLYYSIIQRNTNLIFTCWRMMVKIKEHSVCIDKTLWVIHNIE